MIGYKQFTLKSWFYAIFYIRFQTVFDNRGNIYDSLLHEVNRLLHDMQLKENVLGGDICLLLLICALYIFLRWYFILCFLQNKVDSVRQKKKGQNWKEGLVGRYRSSCGLPPIAGNVLERGLGCCPEVLQDEGGTQVPLDSEGRRQKSGVCFFQPEILLLSSFIIWCSPVSDLICSLL